MINLICDSHQSHMVGGQLGVKGDSTVLRGREAGCGQNITGGGREGQGERDRGGRDREEICGQNITGGGREGHWGSRLPCGWPPGAGISCGVYVKTCHVLAPGPLASGLPKKTLTISSNDRAATALPTTPFQSQRATHTQPQLTLPSYPALSKVSSLATHSIEPRPEQTPAQIVDQDVQLEDGEK